jgi:hypothetical protein
LQYQFNERLLAVASNIENDDDEDDDFGWGSDARNVSEDSNGLANEDDEEEERELPEYKGGMETTASQRLAEGV